LLAITLANLKMMARNRQGLFWALIFPLLLVVVFGLFDFRGVTPTGLAVADFSGGPKAELLRERLGEIAFLEPEAPVIEDPFPLDEARRRLTDGDLGYLLLIPPGLDDPAAENRAGAVAPVTLVYATRNPERNQLVEGAVHSLVIALRSDGQPVLPERLVTSEVIEAPEVDYFDTVLLGLLGLGIMTNSIISIAVRISTYRNQQVLKRLLVTPLPVWKFFAGEIIAHLLLALVQALIILAVGVFVFGGDIHGSPVFIQLVWVGIIVLLGAVVFLNIGFILSAWARNPAAASGMGNAIALPMMFLAGTFFSTDSLPWLLPYASLALPLTPMLNALREVAINSAPLWETWPQLAALAAWAAATALMAVRVFRFS
jgi:ABC-2 type transport system permease protein